MTLVNCNWTWCQYCREGMCQQDQITVADTDWGPCCDSGVIHGVMEIEVSETDEEANEC